MQAVNLSLFDLFDFWIFISTFMLRGGLQGCLYRIRHVCSEGEEDPRHPTRFRDGGHQGNEEGWGWKCFNPKTVEIKFSTIY